MNVAVVISKYFKKFTVLLCWLLKDVHIQYAQTWGHWLYCACYTSHLHSLKGKSIQAVADSRFLMRTKYYSVLWRTVFKSTGRDELPGHNQLVKSSTSQSFFHLDYLYSFLMYIRMTDSICVHKLFFCHPNSAFKNMNCTPSSFSWFWA